MFQANWKRVAVKGFKKDYLDVKDPSFAAFIRAIFGLPYVPLDRIEEGVQNLDLLASKLSGRRQTYANDHISYIRRYWMQNPTVWNFYQHSSLTTNNVSEVRFIV